MEKIWPSSGLTGVTLYPRITVYFDAPVDHQSATQGVRLLNSQSVAVGKAREIFTTSGGKGTYSFEPAEVLQLNGQYQVVLDAGIKDLAGVNLGSDATVSFTTRTNSYPTGNIIESFDNISAFWDPEASGSTVGTDNPVTTFTGSYDILRSGTSAGKLNYTFTGAVLNLYSSDGSLVMNLFSGHCASGPRTVEWSPRADMAPGVYTLRLSLWEEGRTGWRHTSRRWVVVR